MQALLKVTFLAGAAQAAQHKISPTLSPKEDSKFFGPPFPADYPSDGNPRLPISKHFDHPYPVVQDPSSFDADFVKDENGDNGEWEAQFNYDKLRGQIRKMKKSVESAKKRSELEKKEMNKAAAAAQAADGKAKKAEGETAGASKKLVDAEFQKDEKKKKAADAAADADAKAKEADEAAKEADAVAAGTATGANVPLADRVAAAKAKVEEKTVNLQGCKEQLEKAKKDLEDVFQRQKAEMEKAKEAEAKAAADKKAAAKAEADEEAAAHDKAGVALKDATAATAEAEGTLAEQQAKAAAGKADADKAEGLAKQEERQKARADQYYEEELNELKATEADLRKAEMKVRELRGEVQVPVAVPTAVPGVPAVPAIPGVPSSASKASWSFVALLVAASLMQ